MTRKGPVDLSGMDRRFFEALSPEARVELLCRLHALAIEQAEKLARDSTNSSRPPSSDRPMAERRSRRLMACLALAALVIVTPWTAASGETAGPTDRCAAVRAGTAKQPPPLPAP